jgi:alcohol-forming fatty acyl-CoA reductase
MSGWIDNLYGPTGALVATAAGLLRTMHTDGDVDSNIVPCDMAINGILAAAWDVASSR